jgi:hypothetical protein
MFEPDNQNDSKENIKKKNIKIKKVTKPKPKQPSKMDKLMKELDIDDTYTKPIYYKFPKIKDNVFPKGGYNYMADLLELPKTKKEGYCYLLVVVDIWSNKFDFEPQTNKTANATLTALKVIFKRGIIPIPEASLRTDSGSEFKASFDKFLYDHSILHLTSLPDRHTQTNG